MGGCQFFQSQFVTYFFTFSFTIFSNHNVSILSFTADCSPNLRKSRFGRALHFTTTCPIAAGDELCISYLDLNATNNAGVKERRDALRDSWFFECLCARCVRESGEMSAMGG
jgi:SET domain-containing protein